MVAKLDGTNGLLQQYDYQAPTTGFSYTFAAGTTVLVMNPAGTLATGTITMPASPADGMTITFSSTQTITALTLNGNTGQTVVSKVTTLTANQATTYVYRLSNTTWYPMTTVATNVPATPAGGSIITSGTAVATTSGTSIDFTGIPSWVKRITLMNVGVSTNGSSTLMVQLGTSGGIDTTSTYKGSSWQANITITNFSNGVLLGNSNSAATLNNHQVVFTLALPASNTWVVGGVGSGDAGNPQVIAGSKALSGALTTLRLTTANGTDIFDAGSTNILYE